MVPFYLTTRKSAKQKFNKPPIFPRNLSINNFAFFPEAKSSNLGTLRRKTGYSLSLCKQALAENGQNLHKAEKWLEVSKLLMRPNNKAIISFLCHGAVAQSVERPSKVPVWCNSTALTGVPITRETFFIFLPLFIKVPSLILLSRCS